MKQQVIKDLLRIASEVHTIADQLHLVDGQFLMPEIVCLCGSGRFIDTFHEWEEKLTLEGKIVLTIFINTTKRDACDLEESADKAAKETRRKRMLDELHFRKIDLADQVLVLDVDNYIGESTSNEIEYATRKGKVINYLSKMAVGDE